MIAGTPVFEFEVTQLELEQEGFERRGRLRDSGFKLIKISVEYRAKSLAGHALTVAERRERRRAPMQEVQKIAFQKLHLRSRVLSFLDG
jgi:hypothetical protein